MCQCYNRQKKNSVPRTEVAQYRNEISYRKILSGSEILIKYSRQQNVNRKHYTWIFKESEYNKTGLRIKLQKIISNKTTKNAVSCTERKESSVFYKRITSYYVKNKELKYFYQLLVMHIQYLKIQQVLLQLKFIISQIL